MDTIPEKYSDGTAIVAVYDGVTCVGILHDKEESAFLIPLPVFELMVRVLDQYLAHEVEQAQAGGLN